MTRYSADIGLWLLGLLLMAASLSAGGATPDENGVYSGAEPPPPNRTPYLPRDDNEVLQTVPPRNDPKVKAMRTLRAQLAARPDDAKLADKLAHAYIDFGRQLGDAHYAGYATAVIAPWVQQKPPPVPTLVTHAVILQFLHKFDKARGQLKAALKRAPDNSQAWLTLASVDMVQGRYEAANRDCVHSANAGGPLLGIICSGAVRSFTGHAAQAYQLLQMAAVPSPQIPAPVEAYIQGLLAESAERLGHWADAEKHFKRGLAYTPEDNFLLVNYADLLLDRGRPKEVLPLLADHQSSDTAFLRIALAQKALGNPNLARYTWIMAARFEALALRGSTLYGREHSRFALHLLHDPQQALTLAQRNWKVQRAPWDVRVYLEAALAAGKPKAAKPALAQLDNTHLQGSVIQRLAAKLRKQLAEHK